MRKANSILAVVLIIFSILLYFSSLKIRAAEATFFPIILSFFLFFLSTVLLITDQMKNKEKRGKRDERNNTKKKQEVNRKAVLLILFVFFSYRYLLEILGYILPTIFFIASTMWILGYKNKFMILFLSLCVSIGLYLVFVMIFKVPLPEGVLFVWLGGD